MKRLFHFMTGYTLGILSLAACASVTYNYYGLTLPDTCYTQGTLLGAQGNQGWPDLPFTACQPDSVSAGKCVIQLSEDYFKKDKDLQDCAVALKTCQGG